ncbi:MAG TPA: response regulator [Pirellulales bacterium]|nr:response regulator [Pirellulales bacterium]
MSQAILVADDSSTMRKIILRSLLSLGSQEVIEASGGAEAVEKFVPGRFRLILTDWNMPKKSGLEVVREIRALDRSVPIVMVTTESERDRVVEAINSGVSDYLVKPFTADALKAKLEKHGL